MSFLRYVAQPVMRHTRRVATAQPAVVTAALRTNRPGARVSARWFATATPPPPPPPNNNDSNDELKAAMEWIKANAQSTDANSTTSADAPTPKSAPSATGKTENKGWASHFAAGATTSASADPDANSTTFIDLNKPGGMDTAEAMAGDGPVSRPYRMPEKEVKNVPDSNEQKKGTTRSFDFKASTKEILDIVANSLYTDKEVFLRELISNASDALEKFRYLQQSSAYKGDESTDKPVEIHIMLDNVKKTITVQDFGIGMTADELVANLGTIARSGSKLYKDLAAKGAAAEAQTANNIIGQFGVGFYAVFMVGTRVEVWSKSAAHPEQPAHYWTSDGTGNFEMTEAENVPRGTKVVGTYSTFFCHPFIPFLPLSSPISRDFDCSHHVSFFSLSVSLITLR